MPPRSLLLSLAVTSALVAQGATASGVALAPATVTAVHQRPRPTNLSRSKDLWATINKCDTSRHRNTIGIRGSMPGLGTRRSRLSLRIRVQYKAKSDGRWHNAGADSGWKAIGTARRLVIESGQDFRFKPPSDGGSHLLRGSVRFRWKRAGRVVARRHRFTSRGHRSTAGADPRRFSAARCEIKAP